MSTEVESCVINIGPLERRKRLMTGLVILAGGAALALTMLVLGASRAVRTVLFLPLAAGAVSALQAREKT
jgi:hypothetical protein